MNKHLPQYGFLVFYIALMLFGLALTIKPGASIFYLKIGIDPSLIKGDTGFAYRYPIRANPLLFPSERAVFKEDDQALKKVAPNLLINEGRGLFYITDPGTKSYFLYFAPTDNSDPRENGKSYTLYLPIIFLSRSFGLAFLALSGLTLLRFAAFIISSPDRRTDFRQGEFLNLMETFIHERIRSMLLITKDEMPTFQRAAFWKGLFFWSILATYTYVALEWLFFITKPSFFDLIPTLDRVEILFQTGFLLAIPTLLACVVFWGLDSLLVLVRKNEFFLYIASLLPAGIHACLALLVVDNFTYTLFKIGVVSTQGVWRSIYGSLFILVLVILYRYILRNLGLLSTKKVFRNRGVTFHYANIGLLLFSSLLVLVRVDFSIASEVISKDPVQKVNSGPNILLIGSDGLEAANLSIYGYERATTPTILELASSSLIAENAFPNAAQSSGSIISILTSRLPTQTRVLNTPDILMGRDSFQHLPGILKREGYFTAEIGLVHYIDAYNLNVRNGFDLVNNRSLGENIYFQNIHNSSLDDTFYFSYLLAGRISERMKHIFFIQKMEHAISQVIGFEDFHRDDQRMTNLLDIITHKDGPFFVHVHLMVTHGAEFFPPVRQFSVGQIQTEEWMTDFYDDAILSFDTYLGTILEALASTGRMDNTVLVLYTDHAKEYQVQSRIPMVFHFPKGDYAGRITANVQNLDIAPTILDYLDLPIPGWMEGRSLLSQDISPHRLIMASGMKMDRSEGELLKPPFYQFGFFSLIQCNKWYLYNVELASWESGEVVGHTAPCSTLEPLHTIDEIKVELVNHLRNNHFDVTNLP
jgi:hypothetical protein